MVGPFTCQCEKESNFTFLLVVFESRGSEMVNVPTDFIFLGNFCCIDLHCAGTVDFRGVCNFFFNKQKGNGNR